VDNNNIYFKSTTFKDIVTTLTGFNDLKNIKLEAVDDTEKSKTVDDTEKNTNIELQSYNGEPNMWLIITDNYAFFHPYIYGTVRTDHSQGLYLGQWFLMIAFKKNSPYYNALEHHFDHIWTQTNNLIFPEILDRVSENKRAQYLKTGTDLFKETKKEQKSD
jgi:hypothetical protein